MKKVTFLVLMIGSMTSFAGTSVIEKLISRKTTETYSFSNGSYKRIASKTEGKEKSIIKIQGQGDFEDVWSYPESEELISEKFITAKNNAVEIKLVTPAMDGFEGSEEAFSIPADISLVNGRINSVTIGGDFLKEMIVNQVTSELKNTMIFSFAEGEVNPEDINVEKMKVKQSDIRCLAKANKLYCQESLKLHAVITLDK